MRYLQFLYISLLLLLSVTAMATEPTNIIVEIDGKSYYKHLVVKGDTIYSISKAYNVSEQSILECNEGLTPSTLKIDTYILILKEESAVVKTPQKRDKKKFIYHNVKSGETIYSIARKYKVSVATIERDNPDIDIEKISPNMEIRVRRSERGYTTADEIEKERERRMDAELLAEGEYRVKAGETVYSLSRRFGLSEEEFMAINALNSYSDLKEGMIVKSAKSVDTPKESTEAEIEPRQVEQERVVELSVDTLLVEQPYEEFFRADTLQTTFRTLAPYQTLRASMLLPFHRDGKVNSTIVEFYRGVLLAMEDLKNEGFDIELSVFDTEDSEERIRAIMDYEPLFFEAQLIIGPVYENELNVVLPYATENNIPVISPLANIRSLQSPVLFQMQAENDYKYDKFARLFDGSREVIFIYTPSIDREYEAKMREFSTGHILYELNYEFDRESLLYSRNADGTNGEQIDIEEFMRTRSDKAFVVLASNETDVDRVLTTLSSTRASIIGRGSLMGDYVVIGNRRWKQIASIDKQTFFNNNTVFLVPYHANRGNDTIALFDARYVKAYEALPSMYSYRGYDAAMIFCRKMFNGFVDDANEVLMPLTTPYTFIYQDGVYVNTCWTMERYKSNFTIEVE